MGYDMYLIKANKTRLENLDNPFYEELNKATINNVNSYYPILRDFYQEHDELHWVYEEYNLISEDTLLKIIKWLKSKIDEENFMSLDISEEIMTKMVYSNIKNWLPLKENEIVYFEEDS